MYYFECQPRQQVIGARQGKSSIFKTKGFVPFSLSYVQHRSRARYKGEADGIALAYGAKISREY
jgi:hypothetical protein